MPGSPASRIPTASTSAGCSSPASRPRRRCPATRRPPTPRTRPTRSRTRSRTSRPAARTAAVPAAAPAVPVPAAVPGRPDRPDGGRPHAAGSACRGRCRGAACRRSPAQRDPLDRARCGRRPRVAVGVSVAPAFRLADAVPPLTPDGDEARRWAQEELSDPVYTAAEPTPLDRVARAIGGFFDQLFSSEIPNGWGPTLAIVAALVVIVLIVAAFLIWGLPRATRRSRATGAELFGVAEERSAARLRRDAASLADRGDWDGAIVLRFRGLARAVVERDLLEVPPGATVHAFARTAGRVFPALRGRPRGGRRGVRRRALPAPTRNAGPVRPGRRGRRGDHGRTTSARGVGGCCLDDRPHRHRHRPHRAPHAPPQRRHLDRDRRDAARGRSDRRGPLRALALGGARRARSGVGGSGRNAGARRRSCASRASTSWWRATARPPREALTGAADTLVLTDTPALSDDAVSRPRRCRDRRRPRRSPSPHSATAASRRRTRGGRGRRARRSAVRSAGGGAVGADRSWLDLRPGRLRPGLLSDRRRRRGHRAGRRRAPRRGGGRAERCSSTPTSPRTATPRSR